MNEGMDFSLDPFQVDETILNDRLKAALAKQLAASKGGGNDPYLSTVSAMDRIGSEREMRNVESERRQLAQKFHTDLSNMAGAQEDPEIRAMLSNPLTAKQGIAMMQDAHKRKLAKQDYEAANAVFNRGRSQGSALPNATAAVGGGQIPSREELMELENHWNPAVKARAKQMLEAYYTPQDPNKTHFLRPDGAVPVPGMVEAQETRQRVTEKIKSENELVEVPTGQGNQKKFVLRSEAIKMYGPQAAQLPAVNPGSAPNGPGMSGPTPVPAQAAPAPPAAAPAAGYSPPAQQQTPPPALNTAPSPVGLPPRGQYQVPPQQEAVAQGKKLEILQTELQAELAKQPATPQEAQIRDQNVAMIRKELGGKGGAMPPAGPVVGPPAPKMPIDFAEGPPTNVLPTAPFGQNPIGMKEHEAAVKQEQENLAGKQKSWTTLPQTGESLKTMRSAHEGGMPGGGIGSMIMNAWDFMTGSTTGGNPKVSNARDFEGAVNELIGSFQKEYGSNPSNIDFLAAKARVPQPGDSPKTREQFMARMERAHQFEQAASQHVPGLVQKGWTVPQAYEMTRKWFDTQVPPIPSDKQPQKKAEAGGGVLSSTLAALNPIGSANAAEMPPGGGALPSTMSATGGNPYAGAFKGAKPFIEGGVDAWGNVIRGAGQLVGAYSGEDWAKEEARQQARAETDPNYSAGRTTGSVLDPTALIGFKPFKIFGNALVGGTQGLTQPAKDIEERLTNTVLSGIGGAVGGAAGSVVGGTVQKGSKELIERGKKLLDEFPSFKPKSTQISGDVTNRGMEYATGTGRAAYEEQTAAITRDLMKSAGLKGERLSQEGIEAGRQSVKNETNALFPKNVKAKIDDDDKAVLAGEIGQLKTVEDVMAKSPTLAMIHEVLTKDGGSIQSIKASSILDAWREAEMMTRKFPEQAESIKGVLRPLIDKAIGPKNASKFDDLLRQGREIDDIDRVYRSGGSSAEGYSAGYISPAKLVAEAGTGPVKGSKIDKAAELVHQFKVRNPRDEAFNPLNPLDWSRQIFGPAASKVDRTGIRDTETQKRIAQILRAGVQQAPIQGAQAIGE